MSRYILPALTTGLALIGVLLLGDLATSYETIGFGLHPTCCALGAMVLVTGVVAAWIIAMAPDTDLG